MNLQRRHVVIAIGGALSGCATPQLMKKEAKMYGLIGKMKAIPGKRDSLSAILIEGVSGMPGCLSYIVANDPTDEDLLWITEVWDSQESHKASLSLPSVKAAISKGRPLIASMEMVSETKPVGGHGLADKQ
jgi:quinol monooxygenase YgiN